MNSERLLKLADFLENDARVEGHFNMGIFSNDTFRQRVSKARKLTCDAAACAVGWMPVAFSGEAECPSVHSFGIAYKDELGSNAAREFLGIDSEAYRHLFVPSHYPSAKYDRDGYFDKESIKPSVVASRIREFVASGGKVPEHV